MHNFIKYVPVRIRTFINNMGNIFNYDMGAAFKYFIHKDEKYICTNDCPFYSEFVRKWNRCYYDNHFNGIGSAKFQVVPHFNFTWNTKGGMEIKKRILYSIGRKMYPKVDIL